MKKLVILLTLIVGIGMVVDTNATTKEAIFAGGCFWCMEAPFEKVTGVIDVVSGYTGGTSLNPSYKTYAKSGHIEAVKVTYDPAKVTYAQLLDVFWRNIDPTDAGGQFGDRGPHYRAVIFYSTPQEQELAEQSKRELAQKKIFPQPIVTEILPAKQFYAAERYHQDYYRKNPIRYKYFRLRSGRDPFLRRYWR